MKFIFFAIILFPFFSQAAVINLKDGTRIEGQAEGFMDDVYVIRTKYGLLNIKKEEIVNPEALDSQPEQMDSEDLTAVSSETPKAQEPSGEMLTFEIFSTSQTITKIYYENSIAIATRTFNTNNEPVKEEGSLKDGKYVQMYPSGAIKAEIRFENGKENGPAKFFYENGSLQARAEYKNGMLEGSLFSYSPEGKLLSEQNYKDGLLEGLFAEYSADGQIKNRTFYARGQKIEPRAQVSEPAEQPKNQENLLSAKKIKVARGYKFLVYFEKKYKGSFTIKDNGVELENRREGNLPDGTLRVYSEDGALTDEFVFKDNAISRYSKFSNGKTEVFEFEGKGKEGK